MTALTPDDVADLVAAGHRVCPCGAVLRPSVESCRFCGERLLSPDTARRAPADRGGSGSSRGRAKKPAKAALNPDRGRGDLGTLADLPEQTLMLVVTGTPIQQGSLVAVAPGVIRRESGPELVTWRDLVTSEALRVCGSTWVPANAAVQVDITLTVPRPKSLPKRAVPADGYRDLDKLVRAIGDALCPNDPARFRVLASDMRIARSTSAKTHPRPLHTEPWALDHPGVTIRVTPAVTTAADEPAPISTDPVWSVR